MLFDDLRRAVLAWAFAIFALCMAIRIGLEIILPILPLVMCLLFVVAIVAAAIGYWRYRYWDGYD